MKTLRGWSDSIKVSYNPEFRSRVEIYERLGKSVILGGKKSQKVDAFCGSEKVEKRSGFAIYSYFRTVH